MMGKPEDLKVGFKMSKKFKDFDEYLKDPVRKTQRRFVLEKKKNLSNS